MADARPFLVVHTAYSGSQCGCMPLLPARVGDEQSRRGRPPANTGQTGSFGFRLNCGRWFAPQDRSFNGRSIVGMN